MNNKNVSFYYIFYDWNVLVFMKCNKNPCIWLGIIKICVSSQRVNLKDYAI